MSLTRSLLFLFALHASPLLRVFEVTIAQEFEGDDLAENFLVQPIKPDPCSGASSSFDLPTLNDILFNLTMEDDNLTLQLHSGVHCIRNFTLVRDIEDLRIIGNESTTITCAPGVGLAFYNMTGLFLSNLEIDGCGMDFDHINEFIDAVKNDTDFFFEIYNVSGPYIALGVGNSRDFIMENCIVSSNHSLGFIGINLIGRSLLKEVVFESNGFQSCLNERTEKLGGGALLTYHDYINEFNDTDLVAILNITGSSFTRNINCGYGNTLSHYLAYVTISQNFPQLFNGGGGGLSVQLTQLQYSVHVAVSNSTFQNNTGTLGSGAFVAVYTGVSDSHVTFTQCDFSSNGNVFATYQEARTGPAFGSALGIVFDYVQPDFSIDKINSTLYPTIVRAEECNFSDNFAYSGTVAVLSLYNFVVPTLMSNTVVMNGCVFEHNQAILGPAIFALEQKFNPYKHGTVLILRDVTIARNKLVKKHRIQSPSDSSGIMHLLNFNVSFIGNNTLEHNEGSALKIDSSLALFHDNITFLDNSAAYGGAIQVYGTAYVEFMNHSTVHFISNTAGVSGGAIYVHFDNIDPDPLGNCFLTIETNTECSRLNSSINCSDITVLEIQLIFEKNEASLGGMVYGSTLEECLWVTNFRKNYMLGVGDNTSIYEIFYEVQRNTSGEYTFKSPFIFDQPPDNLAQVATPVMQLNASDPQSENMDPIIEMRLAPGISKKINLVAYDGFHWQVPTAVTSKAYKADTTSVLGRNFTFIEYNSTLNSSLYLLTLTNDIGTNTTVSLFTTEPNTADWTITVTLEDCPDGFYFNESNRNCTCYEGLQDKKVYCTEDGKLLGPVNTWVGEDGEGYLNLVLCPFDYCQRSISILEGDSNDYDSQCKPIYSRSGIGCGSCPQNFSLTLGSNICAECSNDFLLLIPIFALYGILLIWLLMHTTFTISGGFLNGLLFFSNILSLYSPVHSSSSIFVVFSWLSLKVGIKTCFFDGMKPLHVAALNFVFPVYLFLILLLIYVAAEKSSRFSSWLSKRRCTPTHLFVTIIVMTYSSLLESCLQALSATTVTVFISENKTEDHVRWRYDPSQRYFSGFHAPLATFSIIVLVFFLIPAPLVCMLNTSGQHFKFLARCTPFCDAIGAPLKPQYRFWVSLRMLFRIFPLIFFYLLPSPYHLFLLELFLLIISFVHGMVQPYLGMAQNVFDGFLQLVLATITLVSFFYTLFVDQLGESDNLKCIEDINIQLQEYEDAQYLAIAIIISFAYAACLIMFIWHLWTAFPTNSAKLKALVTNVLDKLVLACKRRPSECSVQPTRTVFILSEECISSNSASPYGSTLQIVREPVTFSELRESLLEDSTGAADITSINKS